MTKRKNVLSFMGVKAWEIKEEKKYTEPELYKHKVWHPGTYLLFENFIKSPKPNKRRVGKEEQVVGELSPSPLTGDINQVIHHKILQAKVPLHPGK